MTILTSVQNPWIKELCGLQRAASRAASRLFLCEGTHLVQEALATDWPMAAILFTPEWSERNAELRSRIAHDVRQQLVAPHVLRAVATTENPDGVIAVARMARRSKHAAVPIRLAIGVERLQEPGNLGVLIRSASATGADHIAVSTDSVDPYHPKVLRASAGQWFRQSIESVDLREWILACRRQSIQVLAATLDGQPYWNCDLTKPTAFLLGNEGAGLSSETIALADSRVSIPMTTGVESLNVGTTGALLLYEAIRQRRRAYS